MNTPHTKARTWCGLLLAGLLASALPAAPAAAQAPAEPDDARYVGEPPRWNSPPPEAAPVVEKLREAVAEMVDAGMLAPAYSKNGIGAAIYHFGSPAQTLHALSIALPYLDEPLRARTQAYLRTFLEAYPPLSTPWIAGEGLAAREYHPLPPSWRNPVADFDTAPAVPIEALYALWAYGDATGDWEYAQAHRDEMEALARAQGSKIERYGQVAGLIGYARILERLGDAPRARLMREQAARGLRAGADFDAFVRAAERTYLAYGGEGIGTGGDWHIAAWYFLRTPHGYNERAKGPVGVLFAPEIGLFLHDRSPAARRWFEELFQAYRAWGQVRGDMGRTGRRTGERSFFFPDQQYSAHMAQAYVLQAAPATLAVAADYPYCVGDLYCIEKLVATLRAMGGRR